MKALLIKGVKSIISAVLTDENKRRRIITVVTCILMTLFLLPIAAISMPGILFKGAVEKVMDGSDKTGDSIDLKDFYFDQESLSKNKMYIKIRNSYVSYLDSLNNQFDERAEQIRRDKSYIVKHKKSNGTIVKERKYPKVIKNITIEKPELRHLMAFIGTKYLDYQTENDNFMYNQEEALNFLLGITETSESINGKDPVYYKVSTKIKDINVIANQYFNEKLYKEDYIQKQQQFLASFESMADLKDDIASEAYESIDLSQLNIYENGMKIPHILQYSEPWGSSPYGSSTVGKAGCAVTCMAMVQSYLTDKTISPAWIANWSYNHGYYVPGSGTSWSFFKAYSNYLKINCVEMGKNAQKVIKALEEGRPVIARMGPGKFTSDGHFIVLRGITSDGKILVNDPNDNYYSKKYYEQKFSINLIYSEASNFWSFKK